VSFKALKVRTNLTETNWKTLAKAVDQVVSGGVRGWFRDGRRLLRTNLLFAKAS